MVWLCCFLFSSRTRHTSCALVTGVQTCALPMLSIKNDRWIRQAAGAGMIEPFEAGQVRSENGNRIVSYGTSSYGYDVRCAREFKIFTNINSTIVDPDRKSTRLNSSD